MLCNTFPVRWISIEAFVKLFSISINFLYFFSKFKKTPLNNDFYLYFEVFILKSMVDVMNRYISEWPRIELQHLDISMSNLEVISESALDGLRLQTLVLVANKLHYIEQHAFRYTTNIISLCTWYPVRLGSSNKWNRLFPVLWRARSPR